MYYVCYYVDAQLQCVSEERHLIMPLCFCNGLTAPTGELPPPTVYVNALNFFYRLTTALDRNVHLFAFPFGHFLITQLKCVLHWDGKLASDSGNHGCLAVFLFIIWLSPFVEEPGCILLLIFISCKCLCDN